MCYADGRISATIEPMNSVNETRPIDAAAIGPSGNIFLVGMMGAGKTTIGKSLADYLGKTFFDSDREIQKRTGVSIPVIFEIEGEEGFRKRETGMLRELVKLKNIVLATGGGAVLSEENRNLLRDNGTVIYLRATVDHLWKRTRNDKNRPLLQTPDPRATMSAIYSQRDLVYSEAAHIVVENGSQGSYQMTRSLAQRLMAAGSESDQADNEDS
ncbi:shikimate kinase [Nitrosomonadaceae bacterium]|nr:shikimate kinase [Nitrosomonadaceae bacterium]